MMLGKAEGDKPASSNILSFAFALFNRLFGKGAAMARKNSGNDFINGLAHDDPYAGLYIGEPLENVLLDPIDDDKHCEIFRGSFERRYRDNRIHPWRMKSRRTSL